MKFTFWHVMFFAWFCNMAMHIGMADLCVFRYAKKSWYGVATSSGMFLGHFVAWIAASILYALQLRTNPANTAVLPGPMAYQACGVAGLICVVVAGWTTANPTIYRAGLAFQAIAPKSSRYRVTLLTGAIATVAGVFPGLAMKLLDFVALYGLVLMPMGAVIFVDFWLSGKFGFTRNWAERSGTSFNLAAALAWWVTLAVCLAIALSGAAADLLRRPARLVHRRGRLRDHEPCPAGGPEDAGAGARRGGAMTGVLKAVSGAALLATIAPPILYMRGAMDLDTMKLWMTVATLAWFVATPFWMKE